MYIDELNKKIESYPDEWRKGQKYINALREEPIIYALVCGLGEIDCFYSDILVPDFIEYMSDDKDNVKSKLILDLCSEVKDLIEGTHSTIESILRDFNISPTLEFYQEIYDSVENNILEEFSECECCGIWGTNDYYNEEYGFVCASCDESEKDYEDDEY